MQWELLKCYGTVYCSLCSVKCIYEYFIGIPYISTRIFLHFLENNCPAISYLDSFVMFKIYTEMFFPSLRSLVTNIRDQINFNSLTRNTSPPH